MVANGIKSHLTDFINSPEYAGLSNDYEREKILRIELNAIRSEAVKEALGEKDYDTTEDVIRKEKARFFRLPAMDRRIIIEGFKKQFPEVDIEDDDYGMLMQFGVDYGIVRR